MSTKSVPSKSVSLYFSSPYFRPLLDLLARELGFSSHSAFMSELLRFLFIQKGLWDEKNDVPTKEAMAKSPALRKLEVLLRVLDSKDTASQPEIFKEVLTMLNRGGKSKGKSKSKRVPS